MHFSPTIVSKFLWQCEIKASAHESISLIRSLFETEKKLIASVSAQFAEPTG
jgi:hypothetical protein